MRSGTHCQLRPWLRSATPICNSSSIIARGALYSQRKCILNGFCNFRIGQHDGERLPGFGYLIGQLRATVITRSHVEAYLHLRRTTPSDKTGKPIGDKALRHIIVAVKACWNWAADSTDDGGGGILPGDPRPLRKLPRGFVQPKDLSEADLPTAEEIEILFRWAPVDPSKLPCRNGLLEKPRAGRILHCGQPHVR